MSSLYKSATLDAFREWKLDLLLKEYQSGAIRFKQFCDLAAVSLYEGLLILERSEVEPPITEMIDEYSTQVANQLTDSDVFKKGNAPTDENS